MAKAPSNKTEWKAVRLWQGGGYADVFVERSIAGDDSLAVLSVIPRAKQPRVDLKLPPDQLVELGEFLAKYGREMQTAAE